MTRKQNHKNDDDDDNASSQKSIIICDNGGVAPWSELDHDVLYLVMMRLGVVDFLSFSGACKSWRSVALCNRKMYMATKPPMSMWISREANEKDYCNLKDVEERNFKTILPHYASRDCVGSTCGYLVLFGRKIKDFWLVNPITRHQLHFPRFSDDRDDISIIHKRIRFTLVFSPSRSRWLFFITKRFYDKIWFSIAGKRVWNHVSSTSPVLDLLPFKGKIYCINQALHLSELRLNPQPKLTILETKIFQSPRFIYPEFVTSEENLYMIDRTRKDPYNVVKLDFGEMKWATLEEKAKGEYAFFYSYLLRGVAIKRGSWAPDSLSQYKRYECFRDTTDPISRNGRFFHTNMFMWYFPCLSMDVDIVDEL